MKTQKRGDMLVGLDVGTTKVCAIVAEYGEDSLDIVGVGTALSHGIKQGTVVHIDNTVAAIRKAVEEAALMARCDIKRVYLGIAGSHIQGINSHGIVTLKAGEVKESDRAKVLKAARAVSIPADRQIIDVIPQDYIIDDHGGIKDPLKMTGVRLECRVHIITSSTTATKNLVKCCNKAGLEVANVILQQVASAKAVITPDEQEMGVVLIDIGGGTTDIAVFYRGALVHTAVIPVGGQHITADIARGLRTPKNEAEHTKQKYGCAKTGILPPGDSILVPSVGGRPSRNISREILATITEPRLEDLFIQIRMELDKAGCLPFLSSGAVLTGGSTTMSGISQLAEESLGMPVRIGLPGGVGGLIDTVRKPMYSTAVGLVLMGDQKGSGGATRRFPQGRIHGFVRKLKNFMKDAS